MSFHARNKGSAGSFRFAFFCVGILYMPLLSSPSAEAQWAGGTDIFYDGGRVGIGTTSPERRLHVTGTLLLSSSDADATLKNTVIEGRHYSTAEGTVIYMTGISTGTDNLLRLGNNHISFKAPTKIEFFTAEDNVSRGTKQMTITNLGNVGIGVLGPREKLEVGGTVKATEIIVTRDGFPDFVFEEGYDLMPLEDVEAAVLADGHLPGIPSAEEVAESGLGVGEMQALLLQKVEELTLYMIDLKKENNELRAAFACSVDPGLDNSR